MDTVRKPTLSLYYLYRRIQRTRKPLLCKYCPLHFSGISRYLSHLRRHESNIKPYWYKDRNRPPKTGAKRTLWHWRRTQGEIRKHNKLETIGKVSNKHMHRSSQPNEQKHDNKGCHPCIHCGKKFTFPSSDLFCVEHNICRPDGKPSNHYICKSCFWGSIWKTNKERKKDHEKKLQADKTRYQMVRHETTYRQEPSFRCQSCSAEIIKINKANRAYELTHLGLGGTCYEYLQCKQQLQNESILNVAAGTETKVDKLLKCKKCEISFKTEKEMKVHARNMSQQNVTTISVNIAWHIYLPQELWSYT